MLSAADYASVAASKPFQNVDLDAVDDLLESCCSLEVGRGERLLEAGNSNFSLYLLLSGELNVYPGGSRLPKHTVLRAGDCVGEMSLLDGHPVSALVVTARECRLLVIPHDTLWAMVERAPDIARNLLVAMSGRVRNDNLALVAGQARSLEFEQNTKVDPVSGLHNRHWMKSAFPRAMARCERDGDPLCLMLVELDAFSQFHDRHGQAASEAMLRSVALQLAEALRTHDLLARYHEATFAILLPHAATEEGRRIASRLGSAIAAAPRPVGNDATVIVTASFGVVPMGLSDSLESMTAAAALALQRAQEQGNNRVEIAGCP